ncbi:hypothetical protein EXIGLDRAFT_727057 [Exidia glandulosa HHB12029]|uniref:Uncharacterized protein n=1 Tax=Exidia glandulosa HHB12029 TaxID=1314781 RepID=A0A165M3V7_EXIGL|nr:hypothetical protein EXIGLDRAFT_727057 [Exidia glandulosa HHB12029]
MVRFKNRWLLVEFIHVPEQPKPNTAPAQPPALDSKKIWAALKQSILKHFGEIGWGAVSTSLTVKYYSPTTRVCIIRVARDHHQIAWAGATLLSQIDGAKFIPHVVHLSGTIKHTQLAAIKHDKIVIARLRAKAAQATKNGIAPPDTHDAYLERSAAEINALQDQ